MARWGLSASELAVLRTDGFVVLPPRHSPDELERIASYSVEDLARESPRRLYEDGSDEVRAVHGSFLEVPFFADLVRDPRLLRPAEDALDNRVYVHQFKINAKSAKVGGEWQWHQDFTFWHNEDGMPRPNAINVALYIDPVDDSNGPLRFVKGSHRLGDLQPSEFVHGREVAEWQRGFTSNLKYQIEKTELDRILASTQPTTATGPAGTLVVFDCRVLHGSAENHSSLPRKLIVIAYNSCANALIESSRRRPDFIANPDATPLEALTAFDA